MINHYIDKKKFHTFKIWFYSLGGGIVVNNWRQWETTIKG